MSDQALTTSKIRENAESWSLGGDAKLLQLMQDFATRLTGRANDVHREVSQLSYDTRLLDTKIQSVTDYFLTLSDKQFFENRVYDEDVSIKSETNEENDEAKQKTKEEREKELISKLKVAFSFGLDVVENCFDILDMKSESDLSDDEDDGDDVKMEVILEPKDPYVNRPLPYLIGSRDFYEDENVGVGDLPSSDEVESEAGSLTESEEEIEKANTVSDLSSTDISSDDDNEQAKAKNQSVSSSDASSSSSSNVDQQLFTNNKSQTDSFSSEEDKKVIKKKPTKTKKTRSRKSTQNKDFFGGPDNVDIFNPSGDLFSSNNKLFDTSKKSKGLFDDDDTSSDHSVSSNSRKYVSSESEEEVARPSHKTKKSVKKLPQSIPVVAVKKGLFHDDDSSSNLNSSEEDDYDPKHPKPSRQTQSKGLFDQNKESSSDSDSKTNQTASTKKVTKPSKGLFDDGSSSSEDENLFQTRKKLQNSGSLSGAESKTNQAKSKRPVGGVSMFGGDVNQLQAALKKRNQNQSSSDSSEDLNLKSGDSDKKSMDGITKKTSESVSKDSNKEDTLFGEKTKSSSISKPNHKKSLFGDSGSSSDSDLFGSNQSFKDPSKFKSQKPISQNTSLNLKMSKQTESSNINSKNIKSSKLPTKKPQSTQPTKKSHKQNSENIFEESSESDDLFLSKPKKTVQNVKKSSKNNTNNLFDSGSDDELFGSKSTPVSTNKLNSSSNTPDSNRSTKVKPPPIVQSKGLFDSDSDSKSDEDLFLTHKPKLTPTVTPAVKQPEKKKNLTREKNNSAKNISSLLGESENSSDGEDSLFSTKTPVTTPNVKENKEAEKEEKKQEAGVKKVLPGAVSVFGAKGGELFAAISRRRSSSQKKSISKDSSSEDDMSSILTKQPDNIKPGNDQSLKKPSTVTPSEPKVIANTKTNVLSKNITAKPFSPSKPINNIPNITKVSAPKTNTKAIGKLQLKIHINPNAMLPGATPTIKSTHDSDKPLDSATKTRPRAQGGRRPQTRRARQKIAEHSNLSADFVDSISAPTISSPPQSSIVADPTSNQKSVQPSDDVDNFLDNLLSSPSKKNKTKDKKKSTTVKNTEMPIPQKSPQLSPKSTKKKSFKKTPVLEDDLFTSAIIPKTKPTKQNNDLFNDFMDDDNEDMFSSSASKKDSKSKETKKDDNLEDIFGDEFSVSQSNDNKKSAVKIKKHNLFDDDLFGDVGDDILTEKQKSEKVKKSKEIDIFGDLDLAMEKNEKKVSNKKNPNDFDDLFGDNSASKKKSEPKKKKKSTKFTDDLFGEDLEDDLFANTSLKTKAKTSANSKSPKPNDIKEISNSKNLKSSNPVKPEEDEDVYDDPLGALLS